MVIKFSGKNKDNTPYEYYVCAGRQNKFVDKCTTGNIRVDLLDSKILAELKGYNKKILLKTLKESIDDLSINFENERISSIKCEISENESSMNNLIKQLSKTTSQTVSDRLMEEINLLDNNIQNLKKQLELIKSEKTSEATVAANIKYMIDTLKHFDDTIDHIDDINQKRFLVQSLIKSALWDSDTNNVEIILNDGKITQNSDLSKSMDSNLYSS